MRWGTKWYKVTVKPFYVKVNDINLQEWEDNWAGIYQDEIRDTVIRFLPTVISRLLKFHAAVEEVPKPKKFEQGEEVGEIGLEDMEILWDRYAEKEAQSISGDELGW